MPQVDIFKSKNSIDILCGRILAAKRKVLLTRDLSETISHR